MVISLKVDLPELTRIVPTAAGGASAMQVYLHHPQQPLVIRTQLTPLQG